MTRLTSKDIGVVEARLPYLEKQYKEITGKSLFEIGCLASGLEYVPASKRKNIKVACVPITSGQGVITNFSETIAEILHVFGEVNSYTTAATDVAGIHEAYLKESDLIFMADDDVFLCHHAKSGKASDNGIATGKGYAALLCSSDIDQSAKTLLLGAGKVGLGAGEFLKHYDRDFMWFDLAKESEGILHPMIRDAAWFNKSWNSIIDATNGASFIHENHVEEGSILSAPGIPIGYDQDVEAKVDFIFHDELETGVITMLCEGLKYEFS